MTMASLYEEMKASLKFFDLSFGEMHKVNVSITPTALVMTHGDRSIRIKIPEHTE